MGVTQQRITPQRFDSLVQSLVGLPVSRVWRGYGSAIFLELGALDFVYDSERPKGEVTIMIEWGWRVERARSIQFGSASTNRRINFGLRKLEGLTVEGVILAGLLPEVCLQLSGNIRLRSFMDAEGQPEWTIFLESDKFCLTVYAGYLVQEWDSAQGSKSTNAYAPAQ